MNNKSGTIYVIGEKEDESNSQTLFYKCGIVRDGTGRDSHIRLLEHQTGNPRKLVVVETISAPFVEYVETSIHYPIPIHLQPAAKFLGHAEGDFPNTESQAKRILTLPVNQFVTRDEIISISTIINQYYA